MRFWQCHGAFAIAITLVVIVLLPLSAVGLGRDQANWLTVAMALEHGSVMYRDVAVANTPGLGVLFLLTNIAFGAPTLTPWIVHATTAFLIVISAYTWAYFMMGRTAAVGAAIVLALLWPQTTGWWDVAQKDIVALGLAFPGLALLASPRKQRGLAFAAGILFAMSVLTKPTAMMFTVPILLQLWATTANTLGLLRRLIWGLLGAAMPAVACAIYVSRNQAWEATYASLVERASAYGGYQRDQTMDLAVEIFEKVAVAHTSALMLPILLVLSTTLVSKTMVSWRQFLPMLGLWCATFATALVQGRGFTYHIEPLIVVSAIILGICGGLVVETRRTLIVTCGGVAVLAATLFAWTEHGERWTNYAQKAAGWVSDETSDPWFSVQDMAAPGEARAISEWIRTNTSPDDRIFVWGMESQIYVLSDRMFVGPSFADAPIWHPQLAEVAPEYFARTSEVFLAALEQTPPSIFLVAQHDANPVEPMPSDEALMTLPPLVSFLEAHYERQRTTDHFQIYVLRKR